MTISGHSLLWSKAQNNPSWLLALTGSEFSEAVFKHVEDTLQYFDGLGVKQWDVINEMVDQGSVSHTFYQVMMMMKMIVTVFLFRTKAVTQTSGSRYTSG